MANTALDGKPYAGNPHVRIAEGKVASVKPRRSFPLFIKSMVFLMGVVAGVMHATAVTRPVYDANAAMLANLASDEPSAVYVDDNGGVWTYGRSSTTNYVMKTLSGCQRHHPAGLNGFHGDAAADTWVFCNTNGTAIKIGDTANGSLAPGEIELWPSEVNSCGGYFLPTIQFTVPKTARYSIDAVLRLVGIYGDGATVYLFAGNEERWSKALLVGSEAENVSLELDLQVDDTVVLYANPRVNGAGNCGGDAVGVFLTIAEVGSAPAVYDATWTLKKIMAEESPSSVYTDGNGGVWTYGRMNPNDCSTILPASQTTTCTDGLTGFCGPSMSDTWVLLNPQADNVRNPDTAHGILPPDCLEFWPSSSWDCSGSCCAAVQICPPEAGRYRIDVDASFIWDDSIDKTPSTGVRFGLHANDRLQWQEAVTKDDRTKSFSVEMRLAAGAPVKFFVDPNGNCHGDATAVKFRLTYLSVKKGTAVVFR